ncbi:MAG: hypothetical protein PHV97_01640 [Candidatus Omnitrophica bacterium]|nr:hypothetical protein [Candidatus Omnitrophota bacterium]
MSTVKINEQQKEWAIKSAAGVATLLFCYLIMIHPVFEDISNLRKDIMASQKRHELYREVQGLREISSRNERLLATLTERSQLLGKISDIAGRTQLRVATLTPRTEPDGGYIKLRMEMDGQGTFFSLLKFLQAIEKSGEAIKVRDVSLLWKPSPDSKKNEYFLQIQIIFETFLKQRSQKPNV